MSKNTLIIKVETLMTPEAHEKLEEKIRELFQKEKVEAVLFNNITGNILKIKEV